MTTTAAWVVMCAALGMCVVIMVKLWNGFKKEQAEKAAYAGKGGAYMKILVPVDGSAYSRKPWKRPATWPKLRPRPPWS